MNIDIKKVTAEQKETLRNLLEKFDYEFSQYDGRDVDELGNYGYEWLDCYWTEENRFAYFIRVDGKLAGFAMACPYAEYRLVTDFQVAEFFIMHKYRHLGLGKKLATYLLDSQKGNWEIRYHPKNTGAVRFWESFAKDYSNGECEIVAPDKNAELYEDGSPSNMIYLKSNHEH